MSWVRPLEEVAGDDISAVGGKAAHLGELISAGFSVPTGFVITAEAFRAHYPNVSRESKPAALRELHSDLLASLDKQFTATFTNPNETIAVRSSAIGEDSAGHSFAGQHATYYYIRREGLGKAVVDCWLSLWNEAALAYRTHNEALGPALDTDEGNGDFAMAVIIQRMVQADRSGVCFSKDPTGQRPDDCLIEATWGLGAALVDGRVSPDSYFVNADGEITHSRTGRKRYKVAENLTDPDGHRLEPVPIHKQCIATLSPTDVADIATLSRSAEELFGTPQDVEWAFENGRLFALQSRAITASMELTPEPISIDGSWVLFKPLAENFHEPMTPMTVDLFRRILPPMGRFVGGRYYLNLEQMRLLMPFELSDAELAELLLMRGSVSQMRINWKKLPTALGLLVFAYLTNGITWHRTANMQLHTLARFERLAREIRDDTQISPPEALRHLFLGSNPFEPIGRYAFQANLSAVRYFGLLGLLKMLLTRFVPDFNHGLVNQLCAGREDMLSKQMVEHIKQLASIARDDETLHHTLLNTAPFDIQQTVAQLALDHPFVVEFESFLNKYGHRCVKEMDLSAPRWREDTTSVLGMVRNYLKAETINRPDAHGLRLAALDELHQAVPKRWQRRILDYLIERIRFYVTMRENTRHYHTMSFDTARHKLKQLEAQMIQARRLRCADDIFFLTWDEAQELEREVIDWPTAEALIRQRRRRYLCASRNLPPATINIDLPASSPQPDDSVLSGQCACPGYAEGIARVIFDPTLGADLEPGEILIAPYTDPAWTPLFPIAGAIVVEVGSYLSHAGTVAREYQIPCLVDVRGCVSRIRNGQRLKVFASDGRVEIVE